MKKITYKIYKNSEAPNLFSIYQYKNDGFLTKPKTILLLENKIWVDIFAYILCDKYKHNLFEIHLYDINGDKVKSEFSLKPEEIQDFMIDSQKFISPEIFNNTYDYHVPTYNSLIKYTKEKTYFVKNNMSNYWYIEKNIIDGQYYYSLYFILGGKKNESLNNGFVASSKNVKELINNYIREYHRNYNLGAIAYVIFNDWDSDLKLNKLPLKFNTQSLIKILISSCIEQNKSTIQSIYSFISLNDKKIYIGLIDEIMKVIKDKGILITCTPVSYDTTKGITSFVIRDLQKAIFNELSIENVETDFQLEFYF